ncbi:MAG TPA: DUF2721 domain-containing protein [Anaerolineales bacterium]|nr:DUF2721 domain-containing protein [Anaerolineales bacterium]
MELTLTTPALLFPAISLLLLAYTNRFLALAALLRDLHDRYNQNPSPQVWGQLQNLRQRVEIIRNMQVFGVAGFFCCVLCMFLQFAGYIEPSKWVFAISLAALLISLALSLREVFISIDALKLELDDIIK